MSKLKDLIQKIEKRLPLSLQEPWDHCGLNLGDPEQKIRKVLFSYDVCHEVVRYAKKHGCELIVSHHPYRMRSEVNILLDDYEGSLIASCIKNGIALYSCHTNHDASLESLNFHYLKKLGIKNPAPLSPHKDNPVCGLGAYGELPKLLTKKGLIQKLKSLFGIKVLRFVDGGQKGFKRIGICTGSGTSLLPQAIQLNLDAFITGDVKYHQAIDAKRHHITVCDVGHFHSEKDSIKSLKAIFEGELGKKLDYLVYSRLQDAFETV